MINTNWNEINKLKEIGSGKFGTIYKKDDKTAYKIYYPTVVTDYRDKVIDNPALVTSLMRYKALIERSKKLKYSGGINDIIYINNDFAGVVIPYYEGVTLNKIIDKPLNFKIDLAKKIVLYSKELNNYLIYPTDYKMNNIIYTENDVKLIDLDDTRTHVSLIPNPFLHMYSANALAETIERFFQEDKHLIAFKSVTEKIEREKLFNAFTYKKIEDYIKRKETLKNFVFIDDLESLKKFREIILKNNFKIVYVLDLISIDEKDYLNILNTLKSYGLKLFDFTIRENINNYFNLENINEGFTIEDKELKKIYKR